MTGHPRSDRRPRLPGGRQCACGRTFIALTGGLIGRADDLVVRGVNIHPSAVEAIVRGFDVGEFRLVRPRRGAMEELVLEVEAREDDARRLEQAIRKRLALRILIRVATPGSFPRFEMKARRVLDLRSERPSDTV